MSDIANDLIADYEREAKPEGAAAYRDVDVRIRAAQEIRSLRREVREQRKEIAGLREERRALLEADRPQVDELRSLDETA